VTYLDQLAAKRDEAAGTIQTILANYADTEEISESDEANLTDLKATLTALDARISSLTEIDQANAAHAARMSARRVSVVEPDRPHGTLGSRFVASDEFASYRSKGFTGQAPVFNSEFTLVDSISGTDPLGGTSQVSDAPRPRLLTPVIDGFNTVRVSTNATWWLKWPEHAPAADTTAEGEAKTEAVWQPEVAKGSLVKYAHWLQVTEEALEDVPRMRSEIDTALTEGVKRAAEAAAVTMIKAGSASYLDAEVASTKKLVESIRLGLALVQDNGYQPNVVYINPLDYAELDMLLLESTLNGAVAMTSPWGLSYIPSSGITAGTCFVADSAAAFQFQDRGNLSIKMTDSHASTFISNVYTIIGEARGLSVLRRPGAVATCTVATTP
jgi:HK97 family phage major capsid protein